MRTLAARSWAKICWIGLLTFAPLMSSCVPAPSPPTIVTAASTRSASQEAFEPYAVRSDPERGEAAPAWYLVVGVDEGDVLQIRGEPSPRASAEATIPRSARGVRATGPSRQVGASAWVEVVYQGRRGWVNSRYLASDPTYSAPNAVAPGTRVALVVGVNAYADTLPTLQNPIPDARAVAVTLSNLGFRVRLLTDPDAQSIRQGLAWLVEQGSQAEAIMFYFAGHGLSVRGQSALVALPSEGVVSSLSDIDQQMVLLGDVIRTMEASPARSKLVFLDACRNTPRFVEILQRSQNPELANAARGLGRIAAGRNFFVVYSTDPQNVASDGPSDENSPFAGALLARMVEPNVTINETLRLVRQDVIAQTRGAQSPWVEESLSAEFQFAALPAVTPEHFFGGLISEHLMGVIGSDGTVIEYALDPDEPPRAELTERTCGQPLALTVGEMTPDEVVRWIEASGADGMYGIFDSDALIERFEAMGARPGRPRVPYLETRCANPETGGSIWHFDLGGGDLLIVDFSREGYEGWNRYFIGLTN